MGCERLRACWCTGWDYREKIECGGAGNRTPCLSHAKRALYHMSYTPDVIKASKGVN